MSPLISVPLLRSALSGPRPPVLIDVRFTLGGPPGREAYDAGHLPGACFVDLDTELAGAPGPGGRHPLPEASVVQVALRRCGVNGDGGGGGGGGGGSPVVVYDAGTSLSAARAWWIFRYFGLSDVRVLDGGLAAWVEDGGELTTEEPEIEPGDFVASPGWLPVLTAEDVAEFPRHGVLLDVRTPERYAGRSEPIDPVAGHIPGALNAPAGRMLRPDGRFRPASELREYFAEFGIDETAEVATYCGSGVTAAQATLALAVAGVDSTVYIGSWSDWITDPSRPIATDS
jgi:thiosulfate/3-mercaptopyruvate sulfurtransferase